MSRTSAETALQWLRAQLTEMGGFRNATTRDTQFKQWRQNTLTVIQRIWPGVTERSLRFKKVPFAPASNLADSKQVRESFERGCAEAGELLNHWIREIEEKGVIHVPAVQTQSSGEMADYADTLTLDHAPSSESDGGEHEDEVRTLDLHDTPAKSAPVSPGMTPVTPGQSSAAEPAVPVAPPEAAAVTPGRKARKPAAPKSKSRLKDLLGLAHLSAAQGAADHSSATTPESPTPQAPLRSAFSDPPPFLTPQTPPAVAIPPPSPVAPAAPFPAPPPMPAPPPAAEAPGFPVASSIPEPSSFPRSEAPFPLPSNFPMGPATPAAGAAAAEAIEEFEDLEDAQAPDERPFPSREIVLDAGDTHEVHGAREVHEVDEPQPYEHSVEALNDGIQVQPITKAADATPRMQVIPVAPPPAMMQSQAPTPPAPLNSAFAAPAPIEAEPAAPPPLVDPASMLQVVSIDTPRAAPPPDASMIVADEINPSRFSGRTAVVAALAAQLDHMDIPPIDRIALKRFLIDLALRLESNTCAWVDLRAAVITVMEYPQLARRALPALLPFLDRAA